MSMYQCLNCNLKIRSGREAQDARESGCPECGSVEIDDFPERQHRYHAVGVGPVFGDPLDVEIRAARRHRCLGHRESD